MTAWVPIVLTLASMLIAASASAARRRRERLQPDSDAPSATRYLIHAINDDRCTGCESCVSACPTNVLTLVAHKSRAVRFQDCVQCESCARACPTQALVMHPLDSEPPPVRMPEIDEHFQTPVAGQYLIGEVAGKPLVKNAANLGRLVVEHMLGDGLHPRQDSSDTRVDVVIVGSGPAGLSAALTCIHRGLSYALLEKEQVMASTIARYPKGKPFMAEPADVRNLSFLPVWDARKEELLDAWQQVAWATGLRIRYGEGVQSIDKLDDGSFAVESGCARYDAQRVVLAIGTRGTPRSLGIPGEELAKVHSRLDDPAAHAGRNALVVGGGDSAIEAALALANAGASVTLAYRGRAFSRAQNKNRSAVDAAANAGVLEVLLQCNPQRLDASNAVLTLANGDQRILANDVTFVLIGADLPVQWLAKLGVGFVQRPHSHQLGATDQLVAALAADAAACSHDPQLAAARVRGEPIAPAVPERPMLSSPTIRVRLPLRHRPPTFQPELALATRLPARTPRVCRARTVDLFERTTRIRLPTPAPLPPLDLNDDFAHDDFADDATIVMPMQFMAS